jgi:hypothetical protein
VRLAACLPDRSSRSPARCERGAGGDVAAADGDPPRTSPTEPIVRPDYQSSLSPVPCLRRRFDRLPPVYTTGADQTMKQSDGLCKQWLVRQDLAMKQP